MSRTIIYDEYDDGKQYVKYPKEAFFYQDMNWYDYCQREGYEVKHIIPINFPSGAQCNRWYWFHPTRRFITVKNNS